MTEKLTYQANALEGTIILSTEKEKDNTKRSDSYYNIDLNKNKDISFNIKSSIQDAKSMISARIVPRHKMSFKIRFGSEIENTFTDIKDRMEQYQDNGVVKKENQSLLTRYPNVEKPSWKSDSKPGFTDLLRDDKVRHDDIRKKVSLRLKNKLSISEEMDEKKGGKEAFANNFFPLVKPNERPEISSITKKMYVSDETLRESVISEFEPDLNTKATIPICITTKDSSSSVSKEVQLVKEVFKKYRLSNDDESESYSQIDSPNDFKMSSIHIPLEAKQSRLSMASVAMTALQLKDVIIDNATKNMEETNESIRESVLSEFEPESNTKATIPIYITTKDSSSSVSKEVQLVKEVFKKYRLSNDDESESYAQFDSPNDFKMSSISKPLKAKQSRLSMASVAMTALQLKDVIIDSATKNMEETNESIRESVLSEFEGNSKTKTTIPIIITSKHSFNSVSKEVLLMKEVFQKYKLSDDDGFEEEFNPPNDSPKDFKMQSIHKPLDTKQSRLSMASIAMAAFQLKEVIKDSKADDDKEKHDKLSESKRLSIDESRLITSVKPGVVNKKNEIDYKNSVGKKMEASSMAMEAYQFKEMLKDSKANIEDDSDPHIGERSRIPTDNVLYKDGRSRRASEYSDNSLFMGLDDESSILMETESESINKEAFVNDELSLCNVPPSVISMGEWLSAGKGATKQTIVTRGISFLTDKEKVSPQ